MKSRAQETLDVDITTQGLMPKVRFQVAKVIEKAIGNPQIDLFPDPDHLKMPKNKAEDVRQKISGILANYGLISDYDNEKFKVRAGKRDDAWEDLGYAGFA